MTIKGTQWFVQIIKQTHSSHNQNSYEILSCSVGPLDELLSVGNFPPCMFADRSSELIDNIFDPWPACFLLPLLCGDFPLKKRKIFSVDETLHLTPHDIK